MLNAVVGIRYSIKTLKLWGTMRSSYVECCEIAQLTGQKSGLYKLVLREMLRKQFIIGNAFALAESSKRTGYNKHTTSPSEILPPDTTNR